MLINVGTSRLAVDLVRVLADPPQAVTAHQTETAILEAHAPFLEPHPGQ